MQGYIERITTLQRLVQLWSAGRTAIVSEVTNDSNGEAPEEKRSSCDQSPDPPASPASHSDEEANKENESEGITEGALSVIKIGTLQ